MKDLGISIIVVILSGVTFSFLLHTLNQSVWQIFVPIQRDLCKLSNVNRRILNFAGYLLAILIAVFMRISFDISNVLYSLVLGLLLSTIDTCFKENLIDNISKNNK